MNITRIYLITNCYNDPNKVYIGKTKNCRKNAHKKTYGNQITYDYIDEVNSLDRKIWTPLESFWIEYFRQLGFEIMNPNKKGGGGPEFQSIEMKLKLSKPILQYDLDGNFIKRWNSSLDIQEALRYNKFRINQCSSGIAKKYKNYIWIYEGEDKIENRIYNSNTSLIQYDLEGNFIREWTSASYAIKYIGYGKGNNINDCARGKYHQTYGYRWKYKKDIKDINMQLPPIKEKTRGSLWTEERREKTKNSRIGETRSNEYKEKISKLKKKKIYQFDLNNNLIYTFPSFNSVNNSKIIGQTKLRKILNKPISYNGYYYSNNINPIKIEKNTNNIKKPKIKYILYINDEKIREVYKLLDLKISIYTIEKCFNSDNNECIIKKNNNLYIKYKIIKNYL